MSSQPQWVYEQAALLGEWIKEHKPGRYKLIEELQRRGLPASQYRAKRLLDYVRGVPSDWQGRRIGPPPADAPSGTLKPPGMPSVPKSSQISMKGDELQKELNCKLPNQVTCIEDLLDAAGVNQDEWTVDDHLVNRWEMANGQGEVTPLWQVKARLTRKLLSHIRPAPRFETPRPTFAPPSRDVDIAVILPDTQTGFTWSDGYQKLIPYHDRVALEAARQLVHYVQPDQLFWLGDDLDLEELSLKFTRDPMAAQTTQPALDERAFWCSEMRDAAPHAEQHAGDGNHEKRLKTSLQERAPWAVHVRKVGGKWPALSVPNLLGLEEMGIKWLGEYGWEHYLWDKVLIHHGEVVASGGGATVTKILKGATTSSVQGHIHSLELAHKTLWGPGGRDTIFAMSPGCLCRTDGVVPGKGKPDWQQGVGLLYHDRKTGRVSGATLEINEGRIAYEGRIFEGSDRSAEIAEVLGYPQMAS